MAECSCIIHFRYSRKYCNGCNFFATECVMPCPTFTKLPLEYSLFSCHKLTMYNFSVQFGTKRSQVQILSPRPEKAGNRKVSGSFFVSFAQSAVFGAFFMQRMCNLGKRAKDTGGLFFCLKLPLHQNATAVPNRHHGSGKFSNCRQ